MSRSTKRFPLFFSVSVSMNRGELGPLRNLKTTRAMEMDWMKWGLIRIGRRGRMLLIDIN